MSNDYNWTEEWEMDPPGAVCVNDCVQGALQMTEINARYKCTSEVNCTERKFKVIKTSFACKAHYDEEEDAMLQITPAVPSTDDYVSLE